MQNSTMLKTGLLALLVLLLPLQALAEGKVRYSNKWRIEVSGGADSSGLMIFRISPKEQASTELVVDIEAGTRENRVAKTMVEAFRQQLPEKEFHIERDDGEDVLVKRRLGASRFGLQLVENNVEGVRLRIQKE